jgi:hypothetical protein
VKQEPSDELFHLEAHDLLAVLIRIIPPWEGDLAVTDVEDTVIGDGDPVGISAEVLKDSLDAIEGGLAIDNPLLMIELAPELLKAFGWFEMADGVGEYESIRLEASFEKVKELSFEQRRHDPDGDEKPFSGWDPAACVGGESPSGDNTMDVGMIHEVLAPGVKNAYTSDLCPEMLRVVCEFHERFGDWTEKKIVQDLAVHGDQGIEFRREGEDHMEIRDG